MAEKERLVEQLGLRLDKINLDRMRAYAARQPRFKPPLTALLNEAIAEWLERHEKDGEPSDKPTKKK